MPQLVKGGKWVFGWVIVGASREIQIPPDAFTEYGFQSGETVFITHGSQRSGGFGLGRAEKLKNSPLQSRVLGQAIITKDKRVVLPKEVNVKPNERLLAIRGSGKALGFVQQGSIYEEALKHSTLETFDTG